MLPISKRELSSSTEFPAKKARMDFPQEIIFKILSFVRLEPVVFCRLRLASKDIKVEIERRIDEVVSKYFNYQRCNKNFFKLFDLFSDKIKVISLKNENRLPFKSDEFLKFKANQLDSLHIHFNEDLQKIPYIRKLRVNSENIILEHPTVQKLTLENITEDNRQELEGFPNLKKLKIITDEDIPIRKIFDESQSLERICLVREEYRITLDRNLKGIQKFTSGSVWEGTFDRYEELIEGSCIQVRSHSTTYVAVRGGRKEGGGKIIYGDGRVISVTFVKGNIEGQVAFMYNPKGGWYTGEMKNDKIAGKGALVASNGCYYTGIFKNGSHIEGKVEAPVEIGTLNESGYLEGMGERRYKDGSVYKGSFKNGLRHGHGIMKYSDGYIWEGMFINNSALIK